MQKTILQLVVERSKAGFPAIVSQTETLDDDVDADTLMKRIVRKACKAGKDKCDQRVRFETPSGHAMVMRELFSMIKKYGYSSVEEQFIFFSFKK